MRQKPICKQSKIIAASNLFTIEQLHLQFANGEERVYERLCSRRRGAVLIVALTDDNCLLLVREYCAGIDAYGLGFPKGLIDAEETALAAANRELREEAGYAAKNLHWLKKLSLAPGYFSAQMDVILATNLYHAPLAGDEPEPLEVVKWPLATCDELLSRSDFTEARSIAALLIVKQWLNKENNNE